MRILFFGRHFTYFRNFESVLRGLAERGHQIHLAADRDESIGGLQMVQSLATTYPNITFGEAPPRAADDDAWVANHLRLGLDYLRYQHRIFDQAQTLRVRSLDRTPAIFLSLGRLARRLGEPARRFLVGIVRRLERYVPEDPAIREFIASHTPDIVLITPLINLGSSQIEYQRAARGLRIPCALCVWSWDHLSSKALIRDWPDRSSCGTRSSGRKRSISMASLTQTSSSPARNASINGSTGSRHAAARSSVPTSACPITARS